MKFRWTLALAALASIAGILPALAQQGSSLPPPKNTERQKIDRKIDAAAMTPFMTKHQADILKGDVRKGDEMKNDESIAYPQGMAPGMQPGGAGQPAGAQGAPADPNAKPAEADKPKEEPKAPIYRLMGTVCGKGRDVAMFDKGEQVPAMLKAGDMLDPMTKVVSVSRGKVKLERTEVFLVPAAAPEKAADPANPADPNKPAAPPVRKEKKESYELYAW